MAITHKLRWEMAGYLIRAKKCVDSMMFVAEHIDVLHGLKKVDLIDKREKLVERFYMNCSFLIDCVLPSNNKRQKQLKWEARQLNPILDKLVDGRNKKWAHKDQGRNYEEYGSWEALASEMKEDLRFLRDDLCSGILPDIVTLNYVPYDRELFNDVHGIPVEVDKLFRERQECRYTMCRGAEGGQRHYVASIEEARTIPDDTPCCVKQNDGITILERFQNIQDFCILVNIVFGRNEWRTISQEVLEKKFERDMVIIEKAVCEHTPPPVEQVRVRRTGKVIEVDVIDGIGFGSVSR